MSIIGTNFGYFPPVSYDYGTCTVPTDLTLDIRSSGGTVTFQPSSISGAAFSIIQDVNLAPNIAITSAIIRYTPLSPSDVGQFTLFSTATNCPYVINLSGSNGATATLTLIPETTNDFGNVKDGMTSAPLNVLAENNSPLPLTVTELFFSGTSGPIFTDALDVGGAGYAVLDTGTINGGWQSATYVIDAVDGGGSVLAYHLTAAGNGYQPGSPIATTVVTGGGDGNFTITIGSVTLGEFFPAAGQPTLPFTLAANGADPPVVIPVQFQPTITGFVSDPNAVTAVSTAGNSPTHQQLQGTGVFIFPVFTINPSPPRLLLGYTDMIAPLLLLADPLDQDTEEAGYIRNVYDYGTPLYEKFLNRHVLRAEDLGTFDYTVTLSTARQTVVIPKINQGGTADGSVANYFADGGVSDDLITVEISRGVSDGPISITELFHEVERRGEQVEDT